MPAEKPWPPTWVDTAKRLLVATLPSASSSLGGNDALLAIDVRRAPLLKSAVPSGLQTVDTFDRFLGRANLNLFFAGSSSSSLAGKAAIEGARWLHT